MNRAAFDIYIQTQPAPALHKGDGVIPDNLPSHKSENAKAVLRKIGAWLLFLPPYSPDPTPIEMAFAKLKPHLRRIGAGTIEELSHAVGEICDLFSPEQCQHFFKEARYPYD